MHLSQLSLTNVRSFRRLDLDLRPGMHVIAGPNGSGKSNLLEAIALLATTRSARAGNDGDLISWAAIEDEPLPVGRLSAHVSTKDGPVTVEVVIAARPGQIDAAAAGIGRDEIIRRLWDDSPRIAVGGAGSDALFLTSDSHLTPVFALAGRRILCGSGSYVYYHGMDYSAEYNAMRALYETPDEDTLAAWDIGYAVFDSSVYAKFAADESWYAARYDVWYENAACRVYKIK